MSPQPALGATAAPAGGGLRCDGSVHDAQLLANVVVDEVLALRHTVAALADLDRERDVRLTPIEGEYWSARVSRSRGSHHDDASHCRPQKLCSARRIYEPGSFTMIVEVHVNPDLHLRSQRAALPQAIGPLFVDASVEGSTDDDTGQVRRGVTQAIESARRRYRAACG